MIQYTFYVKRSSLRLLVNASNRHSTKRHYRKLTIRRVSPFSPCAKQRAHGKIHLCRAPQRKHTANVQHTTEYVFVVCHRPAHGEDTSLPCAIVQYKAKPRNQVVRVGVRTVEAGAFSHSSSNALYRQDGVNLKKERKRLFTRKFPHRIEWFRVSLLDSVMPL